MPQKWSSASWLLLLCFSKHLGVFKTFPHLSQGNVLSECLCMWFLSVRFSVNDFPHMSQEYLILSWELWTCFKRLSLNVVEYLHNWHSNTLIMSKFYLFLWALRLEKLVYFLSHISQFQVSFKCWLLIWSWRPFLSL